jgi:phosphopantothenoylcysteine decarboxylase/phosphopantothenate--cysteine ligase
MLEACRAALPAAAAVCVAAVADWRADHVEERKLKKAVAGQTKIQTLTLAETPDILATLSQPGPSRPGLVVGFAAETNDVEEHARAKRLRKGCDWIVANDVSVDGVMGGDRNSVLFLTGEGAEAWPMASKAEIARQLADRIAVALT